MNEAADLSLRHIRLFLEVARLQSVSRAADQLNVTQPAVSRALRDLEAQLGTPLFDRVGRGIRLNEAGRIFQAHAAASVAELARGQTRLTRGPDPALRLSIGVLPTAAADLVPRAALAFHARLPEAKLHILTGPNWLLYNQLRDGALDMVVGRMPEGADAHEVVFERLYDERVLLVCRPGHPILTTATPERALMDYPLVLPPKGAAISGPVDRYLASLGQPQLRAAFETVALPIGRKIVQRSEALWFISRGVVADELQAGSLVSAPLSSPILSGPGGISRARLAQPALPPDLFADCLRQIATQGMG